MQRLCTKLRCLALQSTQTQTLPFLSSFRRLLHHVSPPIHCISNKLTFKPFLNNNAASPLFAVNSFAFSTPLLSLVQVWHVSSRERKKRRKLMTPHTSKLKKTKMKPYSSYKSRFMTMADGNIRRWREGKRHNAYLKGIRTFTATNWLAYLYGAMIWGMYRKGYLHASNNSIIPPASP